jgi:hypothetical protein
LASTPSVEAPCEVRKPTSAQCATSTSLVSTSCAALSPARFHAFDADVAVTVCPAVTGDREA